MFHPKKYLLIGLVLIFSALSLVAVPSTLAGGWAVITLDELPPQVVADQPLTVGFIVRQHGRTPMEGLTPEIRAVHADTRESFAVTAKPEGKAGHYVATLTFPQPGGWNWSIQAFTIDQPMPTLTVLASVPVAVEPAAQSSLWSWLLGLVGLSATSYSDKTEAEEVSSAQVEMGRDLFIAKGCIVCHHHNALSEVRRDFSDFRVGPDLPSLMTMSADPAFLYKWLKDPATVKANAKMPNLELKQTEIEALTTFLLNSESTGDPAETTSADTDTPLLKSADQPTDVSSPKAKLKPAELFFIRSRGAKGPLVAYDMANNVEHFRLPAGMLAADRSHYYATIPRQKSTILEVLNPDTSRLERRFTLEDRWDLSGVSPTGRWLALTRIAGENEKQAWVKANQWQTEIQIVDANSGQAVHTLKLDGNFEVETISATGDSLFLVQHLPTVDPDHYLIRLYDLTNETLLADPLRDKKPTDEVMAGLAWSGVASPDGRWLLTLYLNTSRNVAFIHALNLQDKYPICIDLPAGEGDFAQLKYYSLTLAPDGRTVYAANPALGVVAEVSLDTLQVTRRVEFAASKTTEMTTATYSETPTNYSVLSNDGQQLYFSGGWDVWGYNTQSHGVSGPYLSDIPIRGLGLSKEGQRLFVATDKQPLILELANDKTLSFKN